MNTTLVLIIGQVISLGINAYLLTFKSYFTKKGESLATLEDVEELTEKVENTKNRSNLSHQNKLSLNTQTQDALYDFHGKHMLWLHEMFT